MMTRDLKVNFHTLGCKLNYSETSTIARMFTDKGYRKVDPAAAADVCVINTCSVTEHAEKKGRNLIRKIIRNNPGALIVVTGCYAQLNPGAFLDIEGVDLVIGNGSKGEIMDRISQLSGKKNLNPDIHGCGSRDLETFFSSFSTNDRTRSFLKVQDGCDYKCTYCTIPYARGASRNAPINNILEEARKIAAQGIKEIVITGINTGDFGKTTGESFLSLLMELDKIEGIDRYRISSIEPNLLSDEIIKFTAASQKFQPHFHIPLQSGCDRILKLMGRRYTTSEFRDKIEAVRRRLPDCFIGIDVITGFPGETEEDFRQTYDLLESIKPSYIHVFPYSQRPGTPAVKLPGKISPKIIKERTEKLTGLCQALHHDFCGRFENKLSDVLFENIKVKGQMSGYTGNYLRVTAPYDITKVNNIVKVRIRSSGTAGTFTAEYP